MLQQKSRNIESVKLDEFSAFFDNLYTTPKPMMTNILLFVKLWNFYLENRLNDISDEKKNSSFIHYKNG